MPRFRGWQVPDVGSNNVQRHSPMRVFPTQGSNSHSLRINPSSMPPRPPLPHSPRHELPAKPVAAPLATASRKPVEGDCPVCWEAFEPDQTVLYCKMTCGNNFHRACFVDWVTTPKNRLTPNAVRCPMCRGMWDEEELRHIQLENGITPYRPKKVPRRAMDRVREQYRIHRRRSLEQNPGPWSRAGRPTVTVAPRISVDLSHSASPGVPPPAPAQFRDLPGWSIRYSPGMQQAQSIPAPVNNNNQTPPIQHSHNLPQYQMPQPMQNPTSSPMNRAPGSDWVASSGWVTFPNQYQPVPAFGGAPHSYDPLQSMHHGPPATQPVYPQYSSVPQTPRYANLPTYNTMVPQQQQSPQQQHPCPAMRNSYQGSNEVAPTMDFVPGLQDMTRPYPNGTFHQQSPYEYVQYHFSQTYTAWHA
jgi:hypothetical protein